MKHTKLSAAGAIRHLARQYEEMVEAAELLEAIGSLEQATIEVKASHEVELKKLQQLQAQAIELKLELEMHRREDESLTARVKELCNAEINDTNVLIEKLETDAKERAHNILVRAQEKADAMVRGATTSVANLNDTATGLRSEITGLQQEKNRLDKATKEAEEKLQAFRDQMKLTLGG